MMQFTNIAIELNNVENLISEKYAFYLPIYPDIKFIIVVCSAALNSAHFSQKVKFCLLR